MTKPYNSFGEIDQRLKILKLQREIKLENLKLNLKKAKTDIYPSKLFDSLSGTLKQTALTFAIQQLSRVFRRRRRPELLD